MDKDDTTESSVACSCIKSSSAFDASFPVGELKFGLALIMFAYVFMALLPWVCMLVLWVALRP